VSPETVAQVIPTRIHGRYLVRESLQASQPAPLLVGFHGYMESAEIQMERLAAIPGAHQWVLVAIQGLHRFYRGRTEDVVSSWMTRQDRELAIADNKAYVDAVVESVAQRFSATGPLVFAGFSQGVATAFRAGCTSQRAVSGLVVLGGDVPPELNQSALSRVSSVLLGRGERDEWYAESKRTLDIARLRESGVVLETPVLDAAHEWTTDFSRLAGAFLDQRLTEARP
jgi:predicted esterase